MNRSEIEATVKRVLTEEFELEPNAVRDDAHLFDDLKLDSLDAVDLIVALEEAFGARVDGEKAREVRRVSDIYELITRSAQQQPPQPE